MATLLAADEWPRCATRLLMSVPKEYDSAYLHHTLRGKRVIALAGKRLIGVSDAAELRALTRDQAHDSISAFTHALLEDCDTRRLMLLLPAWLPQHGYYSTAAPSRCRRSQASISTVFWCFTAR